MGRRIVGFLVGILIAGAIFSVIAVVKNKQPGAPDMQQIAMPEAVVSEPEPVMAEEPAPQETMAEEVVEETPPVAEPMEEPVPAEMVAEEEPATDDSEMAEMPAEDPPVVAVEPVPQPQLAKLDPLQPELAEPKDDAPLRKPEDLTEAPPAPKPVKPVPNPPVKIAKAEPVPEPEPEPEPAPVAAAEPTPEPVPATPEPEAEAEKPAKPEPAPVVRRSRLPVISDDTERSAGIQFGQPSNSDLPSVSETEEAPDPAVPVEAGFQKAPPPSAPKRLAAPKSLRPAPGKVAILTPEPEVEQAAPEKPRAIDEYGVLFEPGDKPTMSIILVDVGNSGVTLDAAATLDLPVTFAVPVDRTDAALAANRYFETGHEVLALSPRSVELSLSGGQSAQQVSDLVTEFFQIVPQSVGLLDVPEATLQNDRVLSNYVLAALHETGHGLVTYEEGLNVVMREADKAGVPAGLIYRAIDRKGEDVDAIMRHLDRAAAMASRTGHVLVIGSTRPTTIDAIEAWSKTRSARGVSLAPVSASIK